MIIPVKTLRLWRDELAGTPVPDSAFSGTTATWPEGNVYYTFDIADSNAVSAADQEVFVDCAQEWATFANLHFIPWTTQANYVLVSQQSNLEGGFSAVGMIGGQQSLTIGPTSWNHATVCHELGHTLGLVHEHQRSDRDNYVTVFTNDIVPGDEGNFVLLPDSLNQTAYDFLSVMHYSRNSLSISPSDDTLEPLPAYSQYLNIMGRQSDPVLSAADRMGMAAVYGPAPPLSGIVTNTQDSGAGSLRAALYFAFDNPGTTITFDISTNDSGFSNNVFNILPTDQFPSLVHATILDGSTEPVHSNPNGPSIVLNGELAQPPSLYVSGLRLAGTNCVVNALVVNGFSTYGIFIDSTNAAGNSVTGCYLGIDASGSVALTNAFAGLAIANGASGNTVGGETAQSRNVISGNAYQGLVIFGPGTTNNTVSGNYIGLNAAGTAALPNTWSGVNIYGGAAFNIIGGQSPGSGNVVSGNGYQGVAIADAGTTGNVVEGNYIGLNPGGTEAISNGWAGVDLFSSASGNFIGAPGAPNIVSGNGEQGILIQDGSSNNVVQANWVGLDASGNVAISNAWSGIQVGTGSSANQIGGPMASERNVISGNGNQGVIISDPGSVGNVIEGNYIGLNSQGTTAIPNAWAGVNLFNGPSGNSIGAPNAPNIISGNGAQGVLLQDDSSNNVIQANWIGLDASGTRAMSNSWAGLQLSTGSQSNTVGGELAFERNIISGNGNQGIFMTDSGTAGNVMQGNFIGVGPDGVTAFPNGFAGIEVYNGPQFNLIGGATAGMGNVISGNDDQGVILDFGSANNLVQGNDIGLDATGTAAVPNGWAGIEFYGNANSNIVGGPLGARNFIAGNLLSGVAMDYGSSGNVIQGNSIGVGAAMNAIGNGNQGVILFAGAQSNTIGGTALGAANWIVNNAYDGVDIYDTNSIDNTVRGNSIEGNVSGGFNLYSGGNLAAPPPSLLTAVVTTNLNVSGSFSGQSDATYFLDFYASPPADPQGSVYLGARDVTTDSGGSASFTFSFGATVPKGQIITATATDTSGNSSGLSAGVAATMTDTVGDGIPDAWRSAYFGGAGTTTNSSSCAACDPDNDGMSNYQDFLAGIDPNNPASALRLALSSYSNGIPVVAFASAPGVVYRLDEQNDLGKGPWEVLLDQIQGTGGVIQVGDTSAAGIGSRFYRLVVLP